MWWRRRRQLEHDLDLYGVKPEDPLVLAASVGLLPAGLAGHAC